MLHTVTRDKIAVCYIVLHGDTYCYIILGERIERMRAKVTIRKICEYCGKEFNASKKTVRYCSHLCNSKSYKEAQRLKVVKHTEAATQKKIVERNLENISARPYINITEASLLLGVSRMTIYRYVVNGLLPSIQITKRKTILRRIDIEQLFDHKEEYVVTPKPIKVQVEEWYTYEEVSDKYGIKRHQIRKLINKFNFKEKKVGVKTMISKQNIDTYFKKKGFDELISNFANWYSAEELMKKYQMTEKAVYVFASKYSIPKKRQDGRTVYSAQHIELLKNQMYEKEK